MELQEEFSGSNDHSPLVKHKRAKRKTPLSPPATSTATSSESSGNNSTITREEDEDMANCLILLAQGGQKSDSSLYDCKTCNRTFPSFQALGGHRASHNKPKSDQQGEEKEETKPKTSPPLSFHSETKKASLVDHNNNKASGKAHGCSVCGVAFSSGQALGGHMRRHRAPPQISTSDKVVKNSTESCEADDEQRKFRALDLDLNLPAPIEDDDFVFVASKRRFVLPGPALVDCYY